ncbi:MAG: DUF3592 domain-containing protein [Chitinophagaceae bacterium]
MQFGKTSFIVVLTILFVLPFFIYKAVWIIRALPATGTMCFMGKSLNGQFSSEYPVIKFSSTGKDTVFFNGSEGVQLQPGQQVPVLYHKNNPSNARVYTFEGIWVDTVINAAIPFVILLIVFLHPNLIPRTSKIIIGKRPFIQLV